MAEPLVLRRLRRRCRPLAAVTAALLVLSACAGIPTDGAVVEARPPVDDGGLRLEALSPEPGATPGEIVQGFLDAMSSVQSKPALPNDFLTSAAQDRWDRSAITVYGDDTRFELPDEPTDTGINARLTGTALAYIDASGRYTPAGPNDELNYTLGLEKVGTEWRMADVPNRLLISDFDLRNGYEPYVTYFVAAYEDVLVPDRIWLPVEAEALPRLLVQQVVDGPTTQLEGAVRSGFPTGTIATGVGLRNGVFTVELSDEALAADASARKLMAAQLVHTLDGAFPESQGVVMTTAVGELAVPSVPGVLRAEDFDGFDAMRRFQAPSAYVLDETRVRTLDPDTGSREPVPGPLGTGLRDLDVESVAVALDGSAAATVNRDRTQAWVTPLQEGAASYGVLNGAADLEVPSWDRFGGLWLVHHPTPETSALALVRDAADTGGTSSGAKQVAVKAAVLETQRTVALRVAPDGVRVAAVTAGEESLLRVGSIQDRDGEPVITLPTELRFDGAVTEVVWAGPTELFVGIDTGDGEAQPRLVTVDGWTVAQAGPSGVTSIAAFDGRPMLAISGAGNVLRATSIVSWETLEPARRVIYPG